MKMLLCIAGGGAAGALLRYAAAGLVQRAASGTFPWGTLSVNLAGCLMLGALWAMFEALSVSPNVRALLGVGLLGAFTTFSTFSVESLNLLRDREYLLAGANVLGSCVGGLLLVWIGMLAGRAIVQLMR